MIHWHDISKMFDQGGISLYTSVLCDSVNGNEKRPVLLLCLWDCLFFEGLFRERINEINKNNLLPAHESSKHRFISIRAVYL